MGRGAPRPRVGLALSISGSVRTCGPADAGAVSLSGAARSPVAWLSAETRRQRPKGFHSRSRQESHADPQALGIKGPPRRYRSSVRRRVITAPLPWWRPARRRDMTQGAGVASIP